MRINFEMLDLRALLAVSDLRSFRRAAESLGLSQPALSRRIRALEVSFGTPLLERSTRRVAPTAVARQLQPTIHRLIDELENSILSLTEIGSKLRGWVSISSIPTAAIYFLPRVIEEFNLKYPSIRFRILDLSSDEGLESVARGEAEFGISILGASHPDLMVTPLMQDPFMLICRRDHPLARKRQVRWSDLENHRIIGISRESGNRIVLENALAQANVQVQWFYEVSHLSTALGLTESGMGASVLPRLASPETHPSIITKPLVEPRVARTIGLVERRGGALSPAASRFRDLLFRKWGREPYKAVVSSGQQ